MKWIKVKLVSASLVMVFGISGVFGESSLKVPEDFPLAHANQVSLSNDHLRATLYAREFAQGNAVYVEIVPVDVSDVKVTALSMGRNVYPLTKKEWGYRTFIGFSPDANPGPRTLRITYTADGKYGTLNVAFSIKDVEFPVKRTPLDLGKYSNQTVQKDPEVIAFIQRSWKKKQAAFAQRGGDMVDGHLSHPRDMHHVTSPFWATRVYQQYKMVNGKKVRLEDKVRVHRGLDLRGITGTPVFALASGKIVLAEKLYYEGNMVIIDHGNRIFSYYMHMSALDVKAGDRVTGGDVIGKVGSTGVSTASHLHVSLIMQGQQVDPLSILSLPIRD